MPPARYGLRGDDGMLALAQWHEMDGFFVGRDSAYDAYENPAEDLQAIRVAAHGVDWLDRATQQLTLDDAVLEVLGAGGHVLGDYPLWGTELVAVAGSSSATLTAQVEAMPHIGAEWAWDRRRDGRPGGPGGWVPLPIGQREGWLEVARIVAFRENRTPYPTLQAQHDLDGRHVEDLASLFCAVGEALAGPGGYCGSGFADLADCLRYSPRAVARPRLVWREVAVAERALSGTVNGGSRLFDVALGTLAGGAVDVVPA